MVIVAIVIWQFKPSITDFLSRVTKGEGYGVKIEASPSQNITTVKDGGPAFSENDIRKWISENPDKVIEDFNRMSNAYSWERTLNFIYGTQIDLLDHLAKRGEAGDFYINLGLFHAEHQRRSGHTDYQMPDYLNFLQVLGFIKTEGADSDLKVKITPAGTSFLSYIKANYTETWDKKPY